MKTRRSTVALISIAACVLVLFFFLWPRGAGKKDEGPVEKITVGVASIDASALFYIAYDRGFFKEQGLDVKVVEYTAGVLAADDLLQDNLDVVTASEFAVVSKFPLHPEVRILASIARSDNHEVIARKDRGITEPAQLKGKRIAVTRHSSGDFFLGAFLTQYGIPTTGVTFVDLPPPGILDALSSGAVDAAMAWEPTVGKVKERLGSNAVYWPGQSGRGYYFVLMTRDDFIKKRPRAVERLLKALIEAEEYVSAHTPEAQTFMAERLGYDRILMQSLWSRSDFRVRLDQDLLILMEDETRWSLRRTHLKKDMPNYLNVIHWDSLKNIRPEAVSVIH